MPHPAGDDVRGGPGHRRSPRWPAAQTKGTLARWRDAGVTAVLHGMPDRAEEEVITYLRDLGAKLAWPVARPACGTT